MLYVPSANLRRHWEQDRSRVLVIMVPVGAMVRVTSAKEVVGEEFMMEYEIVDLRKDILLHCHDNNGHPALGETLEQVRSLAHWQGLVGPASAAGSAAAHIAECAQCIARDSEAGR